MHLAEPIQSQAITGFVPSMFREMTNVRSQSQGAESKNNNESELNKNVPLNEQKDDQSQLQRKATSENTEKNEAKDTNLLTADASLISATPIQGN